MRIKVAPSVLSADFTRLGEQIRALEAAGADQIHIDVMDGRFVSQISFGLPIVRALRGITTLPLDVHLMVVEPERHLTAFAEAGADLITLHVEASAHVHAALGQIRALGCRSGLALNPHTPALMISEVLPLVDQLVVLAVNPGAAGQALLPEALAKIRRLRELTAAQERPMDILVDGGVNASTAAEVVRAGASILVAGSAIFGATDGPAAGLASLRAAFRAEEAPNGPAT
ncbi:MAG: ribulose-phosphate 3-epimerase [Anaerolineae bacterium]|nr:ribulose-phosphate 3-epimerase [Anaerolineae bacterium]